MALRGSAAQLPWPFWGFLVTVLVGLLLGSHQWAMFADFALGFSYAYWVLRLLTAYLLFTGCLLILEISPLGARREGSVWSWSRSWSWLAGLAALITLPFFTLSVTMLDLLLGLPELDMPGLGPETGNAVAYSASTVASAFARETFYHLDNYLALCALILVPRLLLGLRAGAQVSDELPKEVRPESPATGAAPVPLRPASAETPAFFQRFEPPLDGQVFAVQAQEHYIRVITGGSAVCTLYRFGDALRELRELEGLQVHRSFWVADAGVAALKSGRRGLRIVLRNGEQVPVSAKHADLVQRRYGERLEPVA